ncbi:restriction endonuclease subunit S [Methanosarcina spelaei]|uniref:restriction endonuclease subunit S n=1 Tax=Methanosarcina spelaei TaxID=1036679 RepID=UPI000BABF4C1|nr:restriction endonuclease subunit S [Methanosarcina spelaei]
MASETKFKKTEIGLIPEHWELLKVDDIKSNEKKAIISGPFGSNIGKRFFVESGVPVIRGNNLTTDMRRFIDEGFVFVTPEKADELNTWALVNDIIFTAAGTLGQVGIIEKNSKFEKYIISNKQLRLRVNEKKIYPLYSFYWFASPIVTKLIVNHNTGSTVPLINLSVLKNLPIAVPPLKIQDFIVNILSSLDDKIELNHQINKTLEAMAQAIFKSWFVDFDPVKAKIAAIEAGENAEGVTRAAMSAISGKTNEELDQLQVEQPEYYTQLKTVAELFPTAMQDSELGEIPEGWKAVDLKEMSKTISKGTTPSKKQITDAEGAPSISFIKVKDIADDGQINRAGLELIHESIHKGALKRSILSENDLLFSIAGTIGRVSIVENDLHDSNINQAIAFIRLSRQEHLSLVLEHLKSKRIQEFAIASIVQGVQANVSLASVGSFQIIVPNDPILTAWNKVALLLHNEKLGRQKQNRLLSQLRDTLLPKLLSGELSVDTAKLAEE